jgi:hypothetical protein
VTRNRPAAATPRRPRTSGISGISQIRYCGETTLPNATNAQITAAAYRRKRSRVAGPRAKATQIATSATPTSSDWAVARASGKPPTRLSEPCDETPETPYPQS